jgi:hypothetical protein
MPHRVCCGIAEKAREVLMPGVLQDEARPAL